MALESVKLEGPQGQVSHGEANIVRHSEHSRKLWAGIVAGTGLVLGIASMVVPILHFFSTWILPLAGFIAARKILRREFSIYSLVGPCPVCAKQLDLGGREMHNSLTQWCPHCEAMMTVKPVPST